MTAGIHFVPSIRGLFPGPDEHEVLIDLLLRRAHAPSYYAEYRCGNGRTFFTVLQALAPGSRAWALDDWDGPRITRLGLFEFSVNMQYRPKEVQVHVARLHDRFDDKFFDFVFLHALQYARTPSHSDNISDNISGARLFVRELSCWIKLKPGGIMMGEPARNKQFAKQLAGFAQKHSLAVQEKNDLWWIEK